MNRIGCLDIDNEWALDKLTLTQPNTFKIVDGELQEMSSVLRYMILVVYACILSQARRTLLLTCSIKNCAEHYILILVLFGLEFCFRF